MKFIARIFACYILLVACAPCTDQDTCVDDLKKGYELVSAAQHDHHNDEADHCSPFCICSCCAASVQVTVSSIVVPHDVAHNTKFVIPFAEKLPVNNSYSIWQPPRLA